MMEWPEFLTLAGEVAAGLAARRGETWTVEPAAEALRTIRRRPAPAGRAVS